MQRFYSRKKVLITGGAQGIGLSMADAFVREGAFVIIADQDPEAGAEAMERLKWIQNKVQFILCDVSLENQIVELMKTVDKMHKKLDVLVNNAGTGFHKPVPLEDLLASDFDRILAVNLRGPLLCTKYAMPLLEQSKAPAVLNISSTRAFMSEPGTFGYSASKGGLEALTHSLAISLADKRIRVNAIAPGWIETGPWEKASNRYEPKHSKADKEQHPAGRVGEADDIAQAALFLCSDKAAFITGQSLKIDGGMTVKMIYV